MSLFGHSDKESCSHFILGKYITPADMNMSDERPFVSRPKQFWRLYHQNFGVPPWGWYAWGRRLLGTATIREYEQDVATFLDAATSYAANHLARLVWVVSKTTCGQPSVLSTPRRARADPKSSVPRK